MSKRASLLTVMTGFASQIFMGCVLLILLATLIGTRIPAQVIVFATSNEYQVTIGLAVVDVNVGVIHQYPEQFLANCPVGWSPDGGQLVFLVIHGGNKDIIYVKDFDGTHLRELSQQIVFHPGHPAWSPNNDQIAFSSFENGKWQIQVMDVDKGTLQNLTGHASLSYAAYPVWSPDGHEIAFVGDGKNNVGENSYIIYVMNADGTNLHKVSENPIAGLGVAWSPNGRAIAYIRRQPQDGKVSLNIVNADGSDIRNLELGMDIGFFEPVWSPDGSQIAFVGGYDWDVYTVNRDGSGLRNLSRNEVTTWGINPSWSPDGSQIAYESNNQIYVMNTDGSAIRRLTTDKLVASCPAWRSIP